MLPALFAALPAWLLSVPAARIVSRWLARVLGSPATPLASILLRLRTSFTG